MTMPKRVSTGSPACVGTELAAAGVQGPGSAVWPVANRAYFVPFRNHRPRLTSAIWWWNGSVLTNNGDAGFYDVDGNRLFSTGSTARSGASARQAVSASLTLGKGLFYLALACVGTTGSFQRYSPPNIGVQRATGCLLADTAFVLPSSVTFAAMDASLYIPVIGVDFA